MYLQKLYILCFEGFFNITDGGGECVDLIADVFQLLTHDLSFGFLLQFERLQPCVFLVLKQLVEPFKLLLDCCLIFICLRLQVQECGLFLMPVKRKNGCHAEGFFNLSWRQNKVACLESLSKC